jgi:transcriptional regulator with XRE-family HTH domain
MIRTDLGKRLKQARRVAGLSQSKLGEKIGRGMRSIIHYEKGERPVPFDVLEKWAEATGSELTDIVQKPEEEIKTLKSSSEDVVMYSETLSRFEKLVEENVLLKKENRELQKMKDELKQLKSYLIRFLEK